MKKKWGLVVFFISIPQMAVAGETKCIGVANDVLKMLQMGTYMKPNADVEKGAIYNRCGDSEFRNKKYLVHPWSSHCWSEENKGQPAEKSHTFEAIQVTGIPYSKTNPPYSVNLDENCNVVSIDFGNSQIEIPEEHFTPSTCSTAKKFVVKKVCQALAKHFPSRTEDTGVTEKRASPSGAATLVR